MRRWLAAKRTQSLFRTPLINAEAMQSVALFPKLGLAYNRIQKNANTSVMILLRELETGVVEERETARKKAPRLASPP